MGGLERQRYFWSRRPHKGRNTITEREERDGTRWEMSLIRGGIEKGVGVGNRRNRPNRVMFQGCNYGVCRVCPSIVGYSSK